MTKNPKEKLADQLKIEGDPELAAAHRTIDALTESKESLRRQLDERKRQAEAAQRRLEDLTVRYDLVTALDATVPSTNPGWLKRIPRSTKTHVGIANILISDLHLDEVVDPRQMDNVNAYNREIAFKRMKMMFEKTAEIAFDYLQGIQYEGITSWWAGDNFSGNIHEELKETNETPIMASFEFWLTPIADGLRFLADCFGKVHVPAVVGNHGRNSKKPIAKNRVQDNWDWLLMKVLQRELGSDPRFTWDLPLTMDVTVTHYDHTYLMTHGDQFKGGSGISGIMTPLSLGAHRKSKRQVSVGKPFSTMILGHFHTYMTLPGIIVNGSLKGYDEWVASMNFGYEDPKQAFWVSTPERGPVFHVAVEPMNRKREGW